jgi:hypothetical protein
MNLSDIQLIFNRAVLLTLNKKKNLIVFTVLALCGLLVVFFRALAIHAGPWMLMSLTFLPIFLCSGVLLSTGIILVRIYHDEMKQKPIKFREVLSKSWEIVLGASYFSIPIILCYLLLWIVLGIFVLLKEVPGIGEFFGAILAFAPFLINFGSLILGLFSLLMLFFAAPILALNGLNRIRVTQIVVTRLKGDVFSNILLGLIALFPLLFFLGLLISSFILTDKMCFACVNPLYNIVQWFFIMIPFTALLSPSVVFFFNFSAEAHVLIQRNLKKNS